MRNIQRLVLCLTLAVIASVGLSTAASSASAAPTTTVVAVAKPKPVPVKADPTPPGIQATPQLASSYCGKSNFITPRYCINFSRSEQLYLTDVSIAVAAVFICSKGIVACAISTAIAVAAIRYLNNRGGICPSYNPILEVEYFPHPGGYAKCSDG